MAKAVIFLGSFLTFVLELTVGRTLLPLFGSAASVWVTALCAFQVLLVAGYAYGAALQRPRVHGIVLLAVGAYTACAASALPLARFGEGVSAWIGVSIAVVAAAGPAFVLLSANSTLVQRISGGEYGLYAWSNLGSLAGLAFASLVLDPFVPIACQWWIVGVGAGVVGAWFCRSGSAAFAGRSGLLGAVAVSKGDASRWMALAGIGSASLTAATAYVTTDIVGVPIVWAAMLGLYLATWAVAFSSFGAKFLPAFRALGAAATLCAAAVTCLKPGEPWTRFAWNAIGVAGFLFFGLTAVHARLYCLRPAARDLGRYYLAVSVGGAAGGVLAAVVAPMLFSWVAEWPLCLVAASLAIVSGCPFRRPCARWALPAATAFALLLGHVRDQCDVDGRVVRRERGFYGVMTVREKTLRSPHGDAAVRRSLFNGRTCHGFQLDVPSLKLKPTMYYSLNGGGIAFTNHPSYSASVPMRVGMVGLGIGTLAAYGRRGDLYRFYEISGEDVRMATDTGLFTYLADSRATVEIREGDARIELERDRERGERFDILVIDAYSGDAVPIHLITAEAFRLYADLVKDDGIVAVHVSNWHVDLWPVMKAAAREIGFGVVGVSSDAVPGELAAATDWAFMTRGPFKPVMPTCCHRIDWGKVNDRRLPTDSCGSLLTFVKFNFAAPIEK